LARFRSATHYSQTLSAPYWGVSRIRNIALMCPEVENKDKVGTYDAVAKAGGGYVWDEVLEYRVWCCPNDGAVDIENGNDYYYVFEVYEDALDFSNKTTGAEKPLALILQKEYIDEPEPEQYIHIKKQRIAEWPPEFLTRPRRNEKTIPDFLSPNAPNNKLDIIRGLV